MVGKIEAARKKATVTAILLVHMDLKVHIVKMLVLSALLPAFSDSYDNSEQFE